MLQIGAGNSYKEQSLRCVVLLQNKETVYCTNFYTKK